MLEDRQLDPAVKGVWLAGALITSGVFLIIGLVFEFVIRSRLDAPIPPFLVLGVLVLLSAPGPLFVGPQYRAWRFRVTDDEVITRHGIVWRSVRAIPRYRIQHVDVTSGPFDRTFGVAQVHIYTAGMPTATISIPGLTQAEAEALRDQLLVAGRPR